MPFLLSHAFSVHRGIRRSTSSLLGMAILVGALTSSQTVFATSFNTADGQRHQRWQSLTASLGGERHVRALEDTSYSDTLLSINATAGRCAIHWLELRSSLGERQSRSEVVNRVPVDILVDEQTAQTGTAVLSTQRGDDGLYVYVEDLDMPLLESRLSTGSTLHLRLRMTEQESDYWFLRFSLAGADKALSRLNRLCTQEAGDSSDSPSISP
ncbi:MULTISPECIES: hypothetical protein [Halomonas]|uniref:hypothetical protein n=1 Tax=Halomonas TaxID=2745 RepID=UPI001C984254|nr:MULTISPECIES: hypothetical protein [Halomonas]MBY6206114.1 hypothetical protein [Halomonas sp. DP3Y7-2]MBY6227995.1 hypothetical protein [Halomonas sp. DP3Y7-1]MCA0916062.1 hypothetical protein [Halomonas denitrificans]